MDKVKAFLAQLKRHHFWVLTGLVLILSVTGWYLAAAELSEQYTQNRNKIKSEFDDLNRIVSVVNHPNDTFENGVNKLTGVLQKDVKHAWESVYLDQRDKVLKWPKDLGPDFLDAMDNLEPDKEIDVELRERYLNYVKEEFPRLLKIVDARPYWNKVEDDGGGNQRRRAVPNVVERRMKEEKVDDHDYLLNWAKGNQEEIDAKLDFTDTPKTQAVLFCQENLWVYRAVLDAIASINQGATGHHNAKIKDILTLSIAQEAAAAFTESMAHGRIMVGEVPSGGTAPMGEMQSPMAAPMEGVEGGLGGPMGTAGAKKVLDDKRYVDEKGKPLTGGSTGTAEFKRMPIYLRLWMDQREISALMVALANSPLPVEIRQLRLNPKLGSGSSRTNSSGAFTGALSDNTRRGPDIVKRDKASEEEAQYPYDMPVEMHGIIYIFNPPDKKVFLATAEEGSGVAATATEREPTPTESPATPESSEATPDAIKTAGEKSSDEPATNPDEPKAKPAAKKPTTTDANDSADEVDATPAAGDEPAKSEKPAEETEPAAKEQ